MKDNDTQLIWEQLTGSQNLQEQEGFEKYSLSDLVRRFEQLTNPEEHHEQIYEVKRMLAGQIMDLADGNLQEAQPMPGGIGSQPVPPHGSIPDPSATSPNQATDPLPAALTTTQVLKGAPEMLMMVAEFLQNNQQMLQKFVAGKGQAPQQPG